ncbi:hypothetical protein B4U80_07196 [Leptotrombidium deliense]|uniref:SP-RING-type domain-containing protein n=1 Tax=Leptotrombidium deliense TaxID=299467 RepID=A0A443RUJ9_9ACAR|nr:hypothetical protein B4U80_07196 [Leptotrombidium deliense]
MDFINNPLHYRVIKVLRKPAISTLNGNIRKKIKFSVTQDLVDELQKGDSKHRVILRMSTYRKEAAVYFDCISTEFIIRVNGKKVNENQSESDFYESPIDITGYVNAIEPFITVKRAHNCTAKTVVIGIYHIEMLTVNESLEKIENLKSRTRQAMLKLIRDRFSSDDEIEVNSVIVPLKCPLSTNRIEIAAVGLECKHAACFDLKTFLEVNLETFNWICPLCNNTIKAGMLSLDILMNNILTETAVNCFKVEFDATGNWKEAKDNNNNRVFQID